MRKVFHGAANVIEYPLVHVGRENLDFGKGFYITDIRSQAKIWAQIKSRYLLDADAIINEYDFDFDTAITNYRYKRFDYYDKEWLSFIVNCRMGHKIWQNHDIIEGGVANDRVIDTVEAFIAGMIDEEKALNELSKHQPNNQICILRQTVVDKFLKFNKAVKI